MQSITVRDFSLLGLSRYSAYRHLTAVKRLPSRSPTGELRFELTRAIPAILPRYIGSLPALFDAARVETGFPEDARDCATRLDEWITDIGGAAMRMRAEKARRIFVQSLTGECKSTVLLKPIEYLRQIVILDDEILRPVIVGDRPLPAEIGDFAKRFAIENSPTQLEAEYVF
ncbi:hypothetical protein ACK8OR_01785 [Jannaschia sp. KMU-145]|uniref:hypothetical protein n=1 Tax=Jannaschia halovivens TaxID=3388667 RepID=UPI00396B0794